MRLLDVPDGRKDLKEQTKELEKEQEDKLERRPAQKDSASEVGSY